MEEIGEPGFRARQVADAIFRQRRESLDQASNLPSRLVSRLQDRGVQVGFPKIEQKFTSVDGTVRYLMGFADGQSVETVWMPEGDFGEAGDGSEAGAEELEETTEEQNQRQNKNTDCTDLTDHADHLKEIIQTSVQSVAIRVNP